MLLELLAPNYRPQQVTEDLASFWTNTYPQVRKELRARYPEARLAGKARLNADCGVRSAE